MSCVIKNTRLFIYFYLTTLKGFLRCTSGSAYVQFPPRWLLSGVLYRAECARHSTGVNKINYSLLHIGLLALGIVQNQGQSEWAADGSTRDTGDKRGKAAKSVTSNTSYVVSLTYTPLTFRHRASYIQGRRTATPQSALFVYLVNKYI